jgi:hypothetical protein
MSPDSGKFRFVLKVVGVLTVVGVPLSVGFVVVRDLIREGGVGTPRTFETRNTVRKLALECMIEGVNFGNPEEPTRLPRSDIRNPRGSRPSIADTCRWVQMTVKARSATLGGVNLCIGSPAGGPRQFLNCIVWAPTRLTTAGRVTT